MYQKLFTSFNIGSCTIRNRLVVPAMVTNYCTEDGLITDRYIRYMEEKAKGGWGLLITEDYCVQPSGKGYACIPGLWNDEQMAGNVKLTDTIHKFDSKIFCQMYHPGRQSSPLVNGGVQPVSPSPSKCPALQTLTRELTKAEIKQLVNDFGEAAKRCKETGFDGIEIHAAHGYLLAEFLSSYVNKRTDEYGGCFENRVRILDEIYQSMRDAVGKDFPIQVRICANEYVPGGHTEAESYQLARHCEELGFDCIHVSNGNYAARPDRQIIAPMFTEHALNADTAEQIKKLVHIPVIVTNRINDPMMADTLLMMGKADFIGMGRGSIADPYLPEKAKAEKFDQIRYCIGCLQGCATPILSGGCVTCLVNPEVGREFERKAEKTENPKDVMVIGGGPAGLQAAITAAQKGNKVTVYEATDHLGGQFYSAAFPLHKGELSTVVSSMRAELEALHVEIQLNTEIDEKTITEKKPDSIIIATGAKPMTPPIKGIDSPNVVTAEDVLIGKKDVAFGPAVVCGGGEVGVETAQYIAEKYVPVTILEMREDVALDMTMVNKMCLVKDLYERQVKMLTSCTVKEISERGVTYEDVEGNITTIPAVTVISAFGYKAYNPLEDIARKHCNDVHVIGGAVKAGNALTATRDGYEAGLEV